MSVTTPPARPTAADVQPVANETRDRIITGLVTMLPFIALGVAGWQVWAELLGWHDLVVFGVMYALTGLGVTVGFHRHLTHRAFATKPWVRAPSRCSARPRSRAR